MKEKRKERKKKKEGRKNKERKKVIVIAAFCMTTGTTEKCLLDTKEVYIRTQRQSKNSVS